MSETGFDAALHDRTRRVTPQRRHLYTILADASGHPTADELYVLAVAEMPMLSRRTVYDALALFVELGLVHRIDTGTGAIHYDTNLTMHAHVVCPICHALREADVDADLLRRAVDEDDLDWVDVVIRRRCDACQRPDEVPAPVPARPGP